MKLATTTALTAALILSAAHASAGENLEVTGNPAYDPDRLTVIVTAIDSLMPHEIGQNTPNLNALKAQGTWFTESRSVFSAETIPNHVAMITGAYPENNGIPTNNYWNREGEPEDVNLSLPEELERKLLFTRFNEECSGDNEVSTAAIMSKNYLEEVMSAGDSNDQADVHFVPQKDETYLGDTAGLVPDRTTMQAVIDNLDNANFFFVNLGQVDRMGHVDQTGPTGLPAARNGALVETDLEFANLKRELEDRGRWNTTVLIIVSDHGMDWSQPQNYITLSDVVDPNSLFVVENGGTDSIYVRNPDDNNDWKAARKAYDTIKAMDNIEDAWFTSLHPGWTEGLSDAEIESMLLPEHFHARHENFGDLVVMAKTGYHFAESDAAHAIRGNHGHKLTMHNTFLVTGGADFIRKGQVIDSGLTAEADHFDRIETQSENVDVAPTVAWLFGIPLFDKVFTGNSERSSDTGKRNRDEESFELVPRFDGRPVTEAFSLAQPAEGSCGKL